MLPTQSDCEGFKWYHIGYASMFRGRVVLPVGRPWIRKRRDPVHQMSWLGQDLGWEFDLSWVYPFVWFCFNYELAIVWHHCSIDLGLLWDVEWNFMFGFCWTVCGAAAEKLCIKAKKNSIVAKCNLMWYPFRYMKTQYRMNATCTPSEQVQPMPLSLHGHVSFSDCLNICSSSFSTLACQLVKLLHAVTCEGFVDSVVECGGRRMLLLLLLLLLLANYFSKLYSPYLVLTYC